MKIWLLILVLVLPLGTIIDDPDPVGVAECGSC